MTTLTKLYRCILADPPWQSSGPGWLGGAERHYDPMPVDEIEALRVPGVTASSGAMLWLWATDWSLLHGWPRMVMGAWGFIPICIWPWLAR